MGLHCLYWPQQHMLGLFGHKPFDSLNMLDFITRELNKQPMNMDDEKDHYSDLLVL